MAINILIVDDDQQLRDTLQEMLTDEGFDVMSAEDGFQAVQMVAETEFDLILMDIRMPGMDGVEALIKIKEIRPKVQR